MELQTTCPWCETDIIWDQEIGPEKHCPHCENELSGYRSLEIDAHFDEDEDQEYSQNDTDWDEDNEEQGILRTTREIAQNSAIQSLLNEQYEMPECLNCREYMIEAGTQSIGEDGSFEPKIAPDSGLPLLKPSMKVIWYVCPSCYRTDSYISLNDRKQMLDSLSPTE